MTTHAGTEETSVAASCSLGATAFKSRFEDWQTLRRDALLDETEAGRVLITMWARHAGVGERLRALVEAERQCCSFLGFELEEQAHAYVLRTTFPEGMTARDLVAR
ncbi:MAG: hypothetical protein ACR2M2_00400 [Gaiellaceae bacterium]